jgi:sugar/nucleoside kinase (ribokinase family)
VTGGSLRCAAGVVVIGQAGQDLVLRTNGFPSPGGCVQIADRQALLGGKGANQAAALRELGVPAALLGVVGEDRAGTAEVRVLVVGTPPSSVPETPRAQALW